MVQLEFILVSGHKVYLDLLESETILEAKIKLAQIIGCLPQTIKLVYKYLVLKDSSRLSELCFQSDAIIHVFTVKLPSSRKSSKKTAKNVLSPSSSNDDNEYKLKRRSSKLPPRSGPRSESLHLDLMVKTLQEIGFDEEKCERALRASFYNLDRAAEYLIEDSIPDVPCNDMKEIIRQRDELCLKTSNDNLDASVNNSKLVLDKLSNEEKKSIKTLGELGYQNDLIIQVFIACNKDEKAAVSCLATMN